MGDLVASNSDSLSSPRTTDMLRPPPITRRKSWVANLRLDIGEHICALFEELSEFLQVAASYVASAQTAGAKIVIVLPSPAVCAQIQLEHPTFQARTSENVIAYLRAQDLPVDEMTRTGQFEIGDTKEYHYEDSFEAGCVVRLFKENVEKAVRDGWHGLFVMADMCWASTSAAYRLHLHEHEMSVNQVLTGNKNFVGLCLYDRNVFCPGELCRVLQNHPQAALSNEFFSRNFYYIPPSESCLDPKRLRLDNWLSNLRERKALDKDLEDRTIELHLKNLELQRELHEKAKLEHDKHLVELASEQKSMFVSTLSHEIRTPLHGIMTAALLLNSMDLGEEAQEYTKLVQISSMHLQSVVNDVLSMSLLETGKVVIETEQFSLREAVQATMKMVSLGDAALGKCFTVSMPDLPTEDFEGDKKKLTQVLLNLLVNSSKFTGDDGVIAVSARMLQQPCPDGIVEFTVTDNGIGIPKEKLTDVCRPFFQVEQGNTRRYSGLGLGLSVSKSLIEVLKGKLSIHSEGIGKGTACTFTFPFRARGEACLSAPSLQHHLPVSANTEVLLVEDNRLNAAITIRLLNRLGISRVTRVEDGLSAVESTREGNFDLVLMDLHMPGRLDGFEAARLIKIVNSSRLRRARVVALTANVSNEVRERCEAEMDGYIAKPLTLAHLVEALRNVDLQPSSGPSSMTSVAS